MSMENNGKSLLATIRKYASSAQLGLPVFPGVAVELQQIMAEDDLPPIEQVDRIISKDQALASQVLKMANSVFFAGFSDVRTIRDALLRLGTNQVFNCLIVSSQRDFYSSKNPLIDTYLKELWKHALSTAIGTKWLLKKTGHSGMSDEGFLAGLLHDIGKLLLLRVVEQLAKEREYITISDAFILKVLEALHTEQGYNLMEEWCIPENYCFVVRDHHAAEFNNDDTLLLAVRIVNMMCRKLGLSLRPDYNLDISNLPEVEALGVKDTVLDNLELTLEEAVTMEMAV